LLFSLLMMRLIVTVSEFLSIDLPFRLMMGLSIFFVSVLPIVIVFMSAHEMEFKTSFFLPFIIYGLVYPICYAFFLDPLALLIYPEYYITYLIGGVGLGLIGLAGNTYHSEFKKSMIIFTIGMTIMLINAANVIPVFYYVITGDITPLLNISGFL